MEAQRANGRLCERDAQELVLVVFREMNAGISAIDNLDLGSSTVTRADNGRGDGGRCRRHKEDNWQQG